MKTILVPAAGSDTDPAVFATALAAAQPLGAHLEFLHLRLQPGDAAAFIPHVEFAQGAALRAAMHHLETDQERRSTLGRRHFQQFCEDRGVALREAPMDDDVLSATWREASGGGLERLMRHARHSDLVVLGRASRADGLPRDFVELVLLGSGRPVLLAPARPVERLTGTVLVCWNETPEAARALAAAVPLLAKSRHVIVLSVGGRHESSLENGVDLARQLAWHGISAEARWMPSDGRAIAEQIDAAASEYGCDLQVMGGYGRGRMRELVFGGCTQRFLERAERPVFLMH
jgi:nucleotide-binding universal stress UspA family protein